MRQSYLCFQGNSKLSNQISQVEERQIARKRRLQEYCSQGPFAKPSTPENLHMLAVDDERKYIYCVVPKVGTTTWTYLLARARGEPQNIFRWKLWRRLSSYSEEERSKRLNSYTKFLFVREPWHRMVSAYNNKFIKVYGYTTDIRREIVKTLRPESFKPDEYHFVSFPDFIQYFSDNKTRNQHWRQYEQICYPCVIDYDFIGHYETLREDGDHLLTMLGLHDQIKFPKLHNSTSTSAVLEYYSKVPMQYLNKIAELYRRDFEMFGYDFPGPLQELLDKDGTQENNEN